MDGGLERFIEHALARAPRLILCYMEKSLGIHKSSGRPGRQEVSLYKAGAASAFATSIVVVVRHQPPTMHVLSFWECLDLRRRLRREGGREGAEFMRLFHSKLHSYPSFLCHFAEMWIERAARDAKVKGGREEGDARELSDPFYSEIPHS